VATGHGRVSTLINMAPLTLDIANQMIQGAIAEAEKRSLKVSVAIVDAGGNLVAFSRMDGAEIAGPVLAVDKAYTAVSNRISTEELGKLAQPGGELFGIQSSGGGRFVIFGGGVPLWDGDQVAGGIGVSGASASEDAACATAGAALWR